MTVVSSARKLLAFAGAVVTAALASVACARAGGFAVERQFTVGGSGGWDYLTIDAASARLFISRADRVLVLNTRDGSLLATIDDTAGVHGIALAPALGLGFTSNGQADSVTVFDLKTLKTRSTVRVSGHNPDAILFDVASKHVFTFNGRSHDVSVIDPLGGTEIATLPAGGKPEFAVADDAGHVYFNIEDSAQLGRIDSRAGKRDATWQIPGCDSPTGLALDAAHARLFSVCENGVMAVTDALSGKQVARLPIGSGPDAAAFDAQRNLVFSSNGADGTLTVVHEDDPDHYAVIASVPTEKSARTMALDPNSHRIYLVAAEFGEPPTPTAERPHPRPPVLDGTFKVLVVAGGP